MSDWLHTLVKMSFAVIIVGGVILFIGGVIGMLTRLSESGVCP